MSGWTRAEWKNGRRRLKGSYTWNWAARNFLVLIDGRDPVTGCEREVMNLGDCEEPEWGDWTLVKKNRRGR